MAEPTLTLDEAMAMMDKHAAASKNKKTKKTAKVNKVKDLIKAGAKQGRGGLNTNQRRLLDQIED